MIHGEQKLGKRIVSLKVWKCVLCIIECLKYNIAVCKDQMNSNDGSISSKR